MAPLNFSLTSAAVLALLSFTAPASAANSAGCGKAPPVSAGASYDRTTDSGRQYIIHIPNTYSQNTAVPLILSFHGKGKTASSQQALSNFGNKTYNPNGLAVYPQGVDNAWESAPYATEGVDDIAFVNELLDELQSEFCVDTARIYAAGKSNGGGFVNYMACSNTISHRFAAFAPVSGAYYSPGADNANCHPEHSVTPILEFHGLADTTIPYHGGESHNTPLPDVLEWAEAWAARSGCSSAAPTVQVSGTVTHYTWSCTGNAVQHYAIAGLGHAWPSKSPNSDNSGTAEIEATQVIMDFFNQHTL